MCSVAVQIYFNDSCSRLLPRSYFVEYTHKDIRNKEKRMSRIKPNMDVEQLIDVLRFNLQHNDPSTLYVVYVYVHLRAL